MQVYQIECRCGATEAWARLSETRPRTDDDRFIEVPCEACGTWCRPVPSSNVRHVGIVSAEYSDQLGVEFTSNSQKRDYLKRRGVVEMDADSAEYRQLREQWKDEARSGVQKTPKVESSINGKIKSVTPVGVEAA